MTMYPHQIVSWYIVAMYIYPIVISGIVLYYKIKIHKCESNIVDPGMIRAGLINDAMALCIFEAEKKDEDQIIEYSNGWNAACVSIGQKLSIMRNIETNRIKTIKYSP